MKMSSSISWFVVNFCCLQGFVYWGKDLLDCQVNYPLNAESKTACLKKLFHCSAVDWRFGAPLPTLVMSESIIWNDLTMFIDCIFAPGIDLTLDKGIGRLYLWITSLLISFLSNSNLADTPLGLPKVSAECSASQRHVLEDNSTNKLWIKALPSIKPDNMQSNQFLLHKN